MSGFVDLHCHWVWKIDDGARSEDEGVEMLRRLASCGFSHVVATPHMRPGMFDNRADDLRRAYLAARSALGDREGLPETSLGSEHFFDADVVARIQQGEGLPYLTSALEPDEKRPSGAVLVEFLDLSPAALIERQLFELQTAGFIPVIAHPERYRAVWEEPELAARLVELGSVALLDISALVGKYGRRAQAAAEELLESEVYDAACTDSHRPDDVFVAQRAIEWVDRKYGAEEVNYLLRETPRRLLAGNRPERE